MCGCWGAGCWGAGVQDIGVNGCRDTIHWGPAMPSGVQPSPSTPSSPHLCAEPPPAGLGAESIPNPSPAPPQLPSPVLPLLPPPHKAPPPPPPPGGRFSLSLSPPPRSAPAPPGGGQWAAGGGPSPSPSPEPAPAPTPTPTPAPSPRRPRAAPHCPGGSGAGCGPPHGRPPPGCVRIRRYEEVSGGAPGTGRGLRGSRGGSWESIP